MAHESGTRNILLRRATIGTGCSQANLQHRTHFLQELLNICRVREPDHHVWFFVVQNMDGFERWRGDDLVVILDNLWGWLQIAPAIWPFPAFDPPSDHKTSVTDLFSVFEWVHH